MAAAPPPVNANLPVVRPFTEGEKKKGKKYIKRKREC